MAVKPAVLEEQRKYIVQADFTAPGKKYVEAIALYQKAINLDPVSYPSAYFNLALLSVQLDWYDRAISYIKQFLLLAPEEKDACSAQDKIYEWENMVPRDSGNKTPKETVPWFARGERMRRCLHPERVTLFLIICLSVYSLLLVQSARAGSIPEVSSPKSECAGTLDAWRSSGDPRASNCRCDEHGQLVCGQSTSVGSASGRNANFDQQIKMQVARTIVQSFLTSLFSDDDGNQKAALAAKEKAAALAAARQTAELQRAKAQAAQAAYEKMMQSFKQLDDSQGMAFQTLSDQSMGFKTLDGDAETLEANARNPFDTASAKTTSKTVAVGGATPFFGDTMPKKDIRFLLNPENDPNVVDLRNAVSYVAQNINSGTDPERAKGGPILKGPSCKQLNERLTAYINQRKHFQKTIDLAQSQLDIWEKASQDALLGAAKDGLTNFAGELIEAFQMRSKAADRLQRILAKNGKQMARDGLNVTAIEAKINRLRRLSSTGRLTDLAQNMTDWQDFIKSGLSSLMAQLTSSNQEIREMLEDPRMQRYFGQETPALNALLDTTKISVSYKVLGKWVAEKMPIVGGIELATNSLYNATTYFVDFQRLAKADKINGRVMDTARYIQQNIDDTSLALRSCQ